MQANITIHDHFTSTIDAYDETQWNDKIRSGDVLVIAAEGVVGILDQAWPAAVTAAHGELHTWNLSAHLVRDGDYRASLAVALDKARELGFAVNPLHAPVVTAPATEPGHMTEDEYYDTLCPWCEGYGHIEIFHPSTDALIGHRECTNRDYHKVSLIKPPKPEPVRHLPGCDGDRNVLAECCPPF